MIKKTFYIGILALATLTACNEGNEVNTEVGEAQELNENMNMEATAYRVVPSESVVKWQGSKVTGQNHHGKIMMKEGEVKVTNNRITGGMIMIDMTSLSNEDLDEDNGKSKLEGHLKSDEFFGVEQYPTAAFTVIDVKDSSVDGGNAYVTGNLKIRDQERSISFPATTTVSDDEARVKAEVTFDRTKFNVVYGNENIADLARENMISNNITLDLDLVAKRQGM